MLVAVMEKQRNACRRGCVLERVVSISWSCSSKILIHTNTTNNREYHCPLHGPFSIDHNSAFAVQCLGSDVFIPIVIFLSFVRWSSLSWIYPGPRSRSFRSVCSCSRKFHNFTHNFVRASLGGTAPKVYKKVKLPLIFEFWNRLSYKGSGRKIVGVDLLWYSSRNLYTT